MACVRASEKSLLYFIRLKERYSAKQRRERHSNLKKSLDDIEVTINAIKTQIKEASKMNIDPSVGIDRLARTCVQKQELLTHIGQSLVALKTIQGHTEQHSTQDQATDRSNCREQQCDLLPYARLHLGNGLQEA